MKPVIFYYGNKDIVFYEKNDNVYINATQMSVGFGYKRPHEFLRNKEAKEFIEALARSVNLRNEDIVITTQGGNPRLQGTYMLKQLAIRYAMWLSPEFSVWVIERIEELLTHNVKPSKLMHKLADSLAKMERSHDELTYRLIQLERNQIEAKKALSEYPLTPDEAFPVPELSLRNKLNFHVKQYAKSKNLSYFTVWGILYRSFFAHYHINLVIRARNRDMKPLDYAEKHNYIQHLINIAHKRLK